MPVQFPVHPNAEAVKAKIERLRGRVSAKQGEVLQAQAAIVRLEDQIRGLEADLSKCPGCTHEPHYPEPCRATCPARKRKPERPCACDAWTCSDARCLRLRSFGLSRPPNGCFGAGKHEGAG